MSFRSDDYLPSIEDLLCDGGRISDPPWEYATVLRQFLPVECLLDMGTGDGEFLATLNERPPRTFATEDWEPDLALAKARLEPLGVDVRASDEHGARLPIDDHIVDLVANRHAPFVATELCRVMKPGGVFVTQQVGDVDVAGQRDDSRRRPWNLSTVIGCIRSAGMTVIDAREQHQTGYFSDIEALRRHLQVASWRVPGFSHDHAHEQLRAMTKRLDGTGPIEVRGHRFLIVAHT